MAYNNTFSSLSKKETELIARLTYEKKSIVTIEDISIYISMNKASRNKLIFSLMQKKILRSIKRGVYLFTPLEALSTGKQVNEYCIPPLFFPKGNYYIGYSTMYNYYGFTEQLFQTVYVLNTDYSQTRIISGITYKFTKITPDRLYGLTTLVIDNTTITISSKERTLIDLMYFNNPVGGSERAADLFKQVVSQTDCDRKALIDYAVKFPVISIRKRIGVLLEDLQWSNSELEPLAKSVQDSSIISFGKSRKGIINKKWRVIIDASQKS